MGTFMGIFSERRARPWPERPVSAANKSGTERFMDSLRSD